MNVPTRFLTCVPDLNENPDPNYKDEADSFYSDHIAWLATNFPEVSPILVSSCMSCIYSKINFTNYFSLFQTKPDLLYSHIVHFDSLHSKLERFLRWGGYSEAVSFFHTHFPSERVGGHVIIQERAAAMIGCAEGWSKLCWGWKHPT